MGTTGTEETGDWVSGAKQERVLEVKKMRPFWRDSVLTKPSDPCWL